MYIASRMWYDYTMSNELATKVANPVLAMIQESYPNYHPLLAIAKIAHEAKFYDAEGNERPDQNLAFRCHATIAKYCESEIKSIEIRGKVDHNISTLRVVVDDRKPKIIEDGEVIEDILEPISFENA